ncbi:MAG: hypothetical protein MUF30_00615 [Burkholderiales bacterium]|jgi:hypothetical protein|nr:hypothetical protein [Burkholderiales bacterium]
MSTTTLEAAYRAALAARNQARDALRDEAALLLGRLALRGELDRRNRAAAIAAEREAAVARAASAARRAA